MDPIIHKTAEVSPKAKVGQGTKIWHNSQVLAGAIIGMNCTIGHNCLVGSKAVLGNGVKLESNIDVWDLVTLDDYVFVGPSVTFTNDLIPRAKYPKAKFPEYGRWIPTHVQEGASLGVNATIICGNTVGKWAMVGGGSVVSKDVPDYAIVVGVPAKILGWVCECGNKIVFSLLEENQESGREKAVCGVCGREYGKKDNIVQRINP